MVPLLKGILGSETQVEGQTCMAVPKGPTGAVVYGPHHEVAAGRYRVTVEIGLADTVQPLGDPIACIVDVRTNNGATLFVETFVLHSQLGPRLAPFSLDIFLQEPRALEYRVITLGQVALTVSDHAHISALAEPAQQATITREQRRIWQNEREFMDGYLRNVDGLIHVGANIGQERLYYWLLGIDVAWVEPIREIYERLIDNISMYPRQIGINALLAQRDGDEVMFKIANNLGASSSLLDMQDHNLLFPGIDYVEERKIVTTTLAAMVRAHGLSTDRYQALTLDVEGAERMVLEGAGDLLGEFRYVKCEVADFPARAGTPTVAELDAILTDAGFAQLSRRSFTTGPNNEGTYWDIVWKKLVPGEPLHDPDVPLPLVMNPNEVSTVEKCE